MILLYQKKRRGNWQLAFNRVVFEPRFVPSIRSAGERRRTIDQKVEDQATSHREQPRDENPRPLPRSNLVPDEERGCEKKRRGLEEKLRKDNILHIHSRSQFRKKVRGIRGSRLSSSLLFRELDSASLDRRLPRKCCDRIVIGWLKISSIVA